MNEAFCPTCGRWLIREKSDGTMDMNGRTRISTVPVGVTAEGAVVITPLLLSARCLICHPEEAPSPPPPALSRWERLRAWLWRLLP
jgi:hypothetical protein